jgi:uncharacterized protein (DUF3084 family)
MKTQQTSQKTQTKRLFPQDANIDYTLKTGIEFFQNLQNGNNEINEKISQLIQSIQQAQKDIQKQSSPKQTIEECLTTLEPVKSTLMRVYGPDNYNRQSNTIIQFQTALTKYIVLH